MECVRFSAALVYPCQQASPRLARSPIQSAGKPDALHALRVRLHRSVNSWPAMNDPRTQTIQGSVAGGTVEPGLPEVFPFFFS
jgi:hypothetical protein